MLILSGVVTILSTVNAGILAPAPINTEYDPLPQYSYAYNIQDSLTGDSKSQQESRHGEVVKGSSFILLNRTSLLYKLQLSF